MSSGNLAADYDPDWPGITTLLAGNYGHMHRAVLCQRQLPRVLQIAIATGQQGHNFRPAKDIIPGRMLS